MNRFQNRNVLITGAATGIGRAAALRMAQEGANLALIDINDDKLEKLESELRSFNVKVVSAKVDVVDFSATQAAIDMLSYALGGIQALSHNAGILRCYHTHEMTLEQWNELIAVNLTGTFNVNRHALSHLLKNETSYLVNTSSVAIYQPHPWMAAYAATKGGIAAWTRSLFVEYFLKGLHANWILPGSVESNLANSFQIPPGGNPDLLKTLIPLGKSKLVSADHVASTIALLCSDDAYHINGTEIAVDGGRIY